MTNIELKQIQDRIKFDAPSMALCMGIPYQTYRNYLYGASSIPPQIERAALELEQINKQFLSAAPARIDARIASDFPHGFMGEACECE